MNLIAPILILAVFTVHQGTPTVFKASGTLGCYQGGTWCFFVSLIERDSLFKDDLLDRVGVRCTTYPEYPFTLKGEEDGDEILGNFYKVSLVITHNCTKYGTLKKIEKVRTSASVNADLVEMEWDTDLSMTAGVRVFSYF
ncbi:hypothetical protein GCK72_013035 [Caenorhabditis remanei]|uniref:Uncharacterized protein n=1 Tax=Caenorhabditis remanei TaxID=31234 RepID=E3NJR6_CAERE|nr:hypothetical protein GCK72_013035 [Caenorhabditis remanei]EFP01123.1 hypothetical protein CRE_15762 [Caenorhabditis remanei]KAF1756582.1 hypothetical protein GCK72_013035 [Caenorhabditis remanei]